MTGAGAATVAYAEENSFNGGPGTNPTYYLPGTNLTVDEASIDNFLARIREPDSRESLRSIAQEFEGALSVSFNLGSTQFNNLIFNATDGSSNDILDSTLPTSAEWYLGTDYESGGSLSTAERVLSGWVCAQATIEFTQGDLVRVTLDGLYADENSNTSVTPGSITSPGTEADFDEVTLDIDAVTQTKLQNATLRFDDLARFERGTQRAPVAAVPGPSPVTLEAQAIFSDTDELSLAYGSSSATSVEQNLSAVSGQLTINAGGSTVSDYSLSNMKPDTYDWQDLVNPEESLTEPVVFQVNGISQDA